MLAGRASADPPGTDNPLDRGLLSSSEHTDRTRRPDDQLFPICRLMHEEECHSVSAVPDARKQLIRSFVSVTLSSDRHPARHSSVQPNKSIPSPIDAKLRYID